MANTENNIKAGQSQDLGVAIQNLIQDNIKGINTAFLAKVQSVAGDNKANITPLFKRDSRAKETIIPNVLIAQPASKSWALSYKVEAGDIGLAIVCQNDISTYKNSGAGGLVNTQRYHDIIDSIFLPLSMYINKASAGLTLANESADCSIALTDSGVEIKGGKITITGQSDPLEIGNAVGTLGAVAENLIKLMDMLSAGLTGASSNPATYRAGKPAIVQVIKQILK